MGKEVTRDGLINNEIVLVPAINKIGSRVSLNVMNLHIQSLFDFMEIPIDRP